MRKRFCAVTVACVFLLLASAGVPAAQPSGGGAGSSSRPALKMPKTPMEITDAHVQASLEQAARFLRSKQASDARIGATGKVLNFAYPVGQTGLALLAMLEAGVTLDDPALRAAFTYVMETPTDHTYEVAIQAMVLAKLPKDSLGRSERRAMEALLRRFVEWQAQDGMWTYWLLDPRRVPPAEHSGWGRVVGSTWRDAFKSGDRSNTQFAVLALWEMSKRGVEIPRVTLDRSARMFMDTQNVWGGWSYIKDAEKYDHPPMSPTMNATGLASLYILRDLLGETGEAVFDGRKSEDCGKLGPIGEAIERAHQRVCLDVDELGGMFVPYGGKPFPRSGYYHYSIERVGAASGLKQLGGHDWYRNGAWSYLRTQNKDGSWTMADDEGRLRSTEGYNAIVETSFGMLFLAKGRAPFVINKLRWRGDWNNHARDLPNFTRYAESVFEQRFRWQIADISGEVDQWLDAPILYISGHQPPTNFTELEKRKLRRFVERGGVILADNCCHVEAFNDGFRALMKEVFPEASLRELEADHPVYSSHFKLVPDKRRPVFGLDIAVQPPDPSEIDPEPWYRMAPSVAPSPQDSRQEPSGDPSEPVAKPTRTVVYFCPWNIGCVWNQNLTTNHEWVFQFGVNLFRTATGNRRLHRSLDSTTQESGKAGKPASDRPKSTPGRSLVAP
ncbi:MAG: DUF4159 domain-containing protein [Phycisphaerae bacterium]|nr:DUF4159 domain-containing protein [Phycisphaerae bacterium]